MTAKTEDNTSTDELREICREIQSLLRLDDIAWKSVYGNEGGLWGLLTSYTKQRELALLEAEKEFVDRLKLEVDVVVCDCGEPYKESDLADLIHDRRAELNRQTEGDANDPR